MHHANLRIALPPLCRWSLWHGLDKWLDEVIPKLPNGHSARTEFEAIRGSYQQYGDEDAARLQIARFYKKWLDSLEQKPADSRALGLYQQLNDAYVLGRASLPELPDEGPARRPEIVAKQHMLVCL